jgi:uncharacterized protein
MKEYTLYTNELFIGESEIHGTGLFTQAVISKNKVIMEIQGELIDGDECVKREEEHNNVYIFYKDDNEYVDTRNTDKIKFINHDCDNNCEVEEGRFGQLILVAKRNINSGEELTIDYGYDEIYEGCSCSKCESA